MSNLFKLSLNGKKSISILFKIGKSFSVENLCLFYLEKEGIRPIHRKIYFLVSKKKIKRSVDRNRIKRLLRYSFRINKEYFLNRKEFYLSVRYTVNTISSIVDNMKKILIFKEN